MGKDPPLHQYIYTPLLVYGPPTTPAILSKMLTHDFKKVGEMEIFFATTTLL